MMRAELALLQRRGAVQLQSEFDRRMLGEHGPASGRSDIERELRTVSELQPMTPLRRQQASGRSRHRLALEQHRRSLQKLIDGRGGCIRGRQHHQVHLAELVPEWLLVVRVLLFILVIVMVVVMAVRMIVPMRTGLQRVSTRQQPVQAGPLERPRRFEERVVERQRPFEVESAQAQHALERYVGVAAVDHRSRGADTAYPPLDALERGRIDQVDLVEQDDVGERDLLERDRTALQLLLDVTRIDQRHDRVKRVMLLEFLVDEERLRHGPRVGEPGGLDQHRIEAIAPLAQLAQDPDQVAAHRAADAAVAGFEDLLVGADDQLVIDADLAELVFDHGDALAMILRQDAIDQRGLAGAQKSREHRDRYACRHGEPRSVPTSASAPGIRSSVSSSAQPNRRCSGTRGGGTAPKKAAAASRCSCTLRACSSSCSSGLSMR